MTDLDPNIVYSINVFADYNVEDGKGLISNALIGNGNFTTATITSLGYLSLTLTKTTITDNSADISIGINKGSTDDRLLRLFHGLNVKISKKVGTQVTLISEEHIAGEDIDKLKIGDKINRLYNNLESSTEYIIEITSIIKQGDTEFIFNTISNIKSFRTYKIRPQLFIKYKFVNEDIIDFDARVIDVDKTILSNYVQLEVRNAAGKLIGTEKLNINDNIKRLTYTKLNKGEAYYFKYTAKEYNEGHDNSTYKTNKLIFDEYITTEPGIIGKIGLLSLKKDTQNPTKYQAQMLINLTDTRDEISTNEFYVNVYKEGVLVQTKTYTIGPTNIVSDLIDNYLVEGNTEYKFEVIVTIYREENEPGRTYLMNTTTFTTDKEISGIRTTSDFSKMVSTGKYIVLNDLDFRSVTTSYGTFSGEIDFQGYKVKYKSSNRSQIFSYLNVNGIIKNVNIEVDYDKTVESNNTACFIYYNRGLLQKLHINSKFIN
jgi:hypothetical protein